jgi:hypothetical protein
MITVAITLSLGKTESKWQMRQIFHFADVCSFPEYFQIQTLRTGSIRNQMAAV